MKQVTIKAVTVNRDFTEQDKAYICRMMLVLQDHNLSVSVSYSQDRHKKKLNNIKLKVS